MNVIIRLQNLPWSANALDIRNFFKGLSIPEGGVHIVGGSNGDAFIAFSSDEDARQAMMLNGSKLKDAHVLLNLSSRTEMQKVIEKARLAYTAPVVAAPVVVPQVVPQVVPPPAPAIGALTNMSVPVTTAAATIPKPVDAATLQSLYSLYAATGMNPAAQSLLGLNSNEAFLKYFYSQAGVAIPGLQTIAPTTTIMTPVTTAPLTTAIPIIDITKKSSSDLDKKKEVTIVPSKSSYKRSRSRSRSRSHSRSRSRSSEDRYSRRRRDKDRSNSRERRRSSRDRDRYDRRDRSKRDSRERERDREKDRGRYRRSSSRERSRSYNTNSTSSKDPRSYNSSRNDLDSNSRNQSSSVWEKPPQQFNASSNDREKLPVQPFNLNERDKLLEIKNKRNPNAFQNTQPEEPPMTTKNDDDYGHCVRIGNVERDCFYSDIRRFFFGLAIGQNDIKIMYDQEYGNRTGEVLVRFLSPESKKIALEKNLTVLKNNVVTISSISDDDFQKALDKPNKQSGNKFSSNSGTNYISSEEAKKVKNPDDFWDDDGEKVDAEVKTFDVKYNYLMVDDLPRFCRIDDIRRSFPTAVEIAFPKNAVFLRYPNPLEAKKVMDDRYAHYINNKRVYLSISDVNEFSKEKAACRPEFIWCGDKKKEDEVIVLDDDDMDPRGNRNNGRSHFNSGSNSNNKNANFNAFKNNWNNNVDSNFADSKNNWNASNSNSNWNTGNSNSNSNPNWNRNAETKTRWSQPTNDSSSRNDYSTASDSKASYNTTSRWNTNSNSNSSDWNGTAEPDMEWNDNKNDSGEKMSKSEDFNNSGSNLKLRDDIENSNKISPSTVTTAQSKIPPPSLLDLNIKIDVPHGQLMEILEEDVTESDCIIMKNLTPKTTEIDVVSFLRKIDINPQRVHILWDKQGKPSGDCFCEFATTKIASQSLQLDNFSLDGNIVTIKLIPREKVDAILKSLGDSPSKQAGNIGAGSTNGGGGGSSNGNSMNSFNDSMDDGDECLVFLSNVPYYCHVDDVLDRFREFDLKPEQVTRRFNNNGKPTGNIIIRFNSPEDAMSARRKKIRINGRYIFMKTAE